MTAYIGKRSTSSAPVRFTNDGGRAWALRHLSRPSLTAPAGGWCPGRRAAARAARCRPVRGRLPARRAARRSLAYRPGSRCPGRVPASPSTRATTMGLLGDSLSFSVQGVSSTGLVGGPTSDQVCTQAWQPPACRRSPTFCCRGRGRPNHYRCPQVVVAPSAQMNWPSAATK